MEGERTNPQAIAASMVCFVHTVMKCLTYFAVLKPEKSGYSAYFPDLPGCTALGDDIQEASENAEAALNAWYYEREKNQQPIPTPSKSVSAEHAKGNIVYPIPIYPQLYSEAQKNRRVKTNTTIPAWLKEKAQAQNLNLSQVLETALLELFENESDNH